MLFTLSFETFYQRPYLDEDIKTTQISHMIPFINENNNKTCFIFTPIFNFRLKQ